MTGLETSDEPLETGANHEREFRIYRDRFYKRSLRPAEYRVYGQNGPYVPPMGLERLQNEAACLEFVRDDASIPVPDVLEAYNDDGSFVLVTRRLMGVSMNKLPPDDQAIVAKEVETHLRALHALRSNRTGGPSGIVCPPNRATQYFPRDATWSAKSTADNSDSFVFCHCDLSQSNIIVDPKTLRIEGIIDWEYAGFWPEFFESPYFRDSRPSGAQFRDEAQNVHLVGFLRGQLRPSI
ncbi:kinase-like domain-containing protein [Cercophora scortea]|uniref:Kinase-like domain-containing protein n=1 Tax=Cercophora scortea TaxID=314031 RepID=A0AAE0J728_9PEZI|nr:kinase-like domain-containing protein [Cercophora scortea]